jgi:hypothetical protein
MYCFDATENQLMNPTRFRFAIAKRTVLIAAIVGVWDCWSLGLLESGIVGVWTGTTPPTAAEETRRHDVVVYGGTSAGIAAAVQVVIEP